MRTVRVATLGAVVLLAGLSLVPPALNAGAENGGGDVNVTAEFYTAFDGGGGYLTWDFSPDASARLRSTMDTDGDGQVSDAEFNVYQQGVDSNLERTVLVLRNFDIAAVRVVEQRGFVGEAVDSGAAAHLKFILNGKWAARDTEVALVGGGAVEAAFPDVADTDRVHERTVILAAGASSFVPLAGEALAPRVPGGSVVVHTEDYVWGQRSGAAPDVRFLRFSLLDSTLTLLVPLALAYYLGLRRPRLEQEASGYPRIAPFHDLLSSLFLLLLVAYFAGVPGPVLWVAGVAFGVFGLWWSYRLYPVDGPRAPASTDVATPGSSRHFEAAMALMPEAHKPVGEGQLPFRPPAAARGVGSASHGRPPSFAANAPGEPKGASRSAPGGGPNGGPHRPAPAWKPASEGEWAPVPEGEWAPVEEDDIHIDIPARVEPAVARAAPPRPAAPVAPQARAPPKAAAPKPPTTTVRCPGCRHQFGTSGTRPIAILCPHCGKRGFLR